jgi:hypothetical protein
VSEYLQKVNNHQGKKEASVGIRFSKLPACRKDYPIESGIFSCPGSRAGRSTRCAGYAPRHKLLKATKVMGEGSRRSFYLFQPSFRLQLLGYGRLDGYWTGCGTADALGGSGFSDPWSLNPSAPLGRPAFVGEENRHVTDPAGPAPDGTLL